MAREVNIRAIVVQGLSVLLLCAFIELGAGKVFEGMRGYFMATGLIVMVPPLLGLRGNINGALASRLGTGLNAGLIKPRLAMSTDVKVNLASALILSVIASATIGVFAFGVNVLTGAPTIGVLELMAIAVLAGFLSALILAFLTVLVAIMSYARGWDPDNVTSPTMASIGDFVTIACIYLAVLLVV